MHVWVGIWVDVLVTAQYDFTKQTGRHAESQASDAAFFLLLGETGGKAATSSLFLTSGRGEFSLIEAKGVSL